MKPVLDFDDDDEEEGNSLSAALGACDTGDGETGQYSMEKYFSNGDADRVKAPDAFNRRNARARRYSGDEHDPNT